MIGDFKCKDFKPRQSFTMGLIYVRYRTHLRKNFFTSSVFNSMSRVGLTAHVVKLPRNICLRNQELNVNNPAFRLFTSCRSRMREISNLMDRNKVVHPIFGVHLNHVTKDLTASVNSIPDTPSPTSLN